MQSMMMAGRSRRSRGHLHVEAHPTADGNVGRMLLPTLMLMLIGQGAAIATHIWSAAIQHQWAFLVLGTLAYPVGVAHGIGVWLSWWK